MAAEFIGNSAVNFAFEAMAQLKVRGMFVLDRATAALLMFATATIAASPLAAQTGDTATDPTAVTDGAAEDAIREFTNWVVASGDNNGSPFLVIDKVTARVFVFDDRSQFIAATPALMGAAVGDDSVPGIGDRELSAIRPEERTTPAGRFVARIGTATGNHEVLWVDYATSVSLHPVVNVRNERRSQRLKSPSPSDNRITYGCINVPASFYAKVVRPLFAESQGIAYILPETKPLTETFPAFAAHDRAMRAQISN